MKKKIIILLIFLVSLLAAETIELTENVNRPLYEKVPLIRDYRINQLIKGAIRWSSVFTLVGVTIGTLSSSGNYVNGSLISPMFLIGLSGGTVYGTYQGFRAYNRKKESNDFYIPSDSFGYEFRMFKYGFHEEYSSTPKTEIGFYITADYKYRLFDEFLLGALYCEWIDREAKETKFDLCGLQSLSKNKVFSPYWGFGVGLSLGQMNGITDEDKNKKVIDGLFPYCHPMVGIQMNIWDFFFFKFELDCEFSSFYFNLLEYRNYSFKQNFTTSFTFGTKIF